MNRWRFGFHAAGGMKYFFVVIALLTNFVSARRLNEIFKWKTRQSYMIWWVFWAHFHPFGVPRIELGLWGLLCIFQLRVVRWGGYAISFHSIFCHLLCNGHSRHSLLISMSHICVFAYGPVSLSVDIGARQQSGASIIFRFCLCSQE